MAKKARLVIPKFIVFFLGHSVGECWSNIETTQTRTFDDQYEAALFAKRVRGKVFGLNPEYEPTVVAELKAKE